ncbi:MAG: PadR family transcriptional regulator [Gemmatimonadaceae bacterium]
MSGFDCWISGMRRGMWKGANFGFDPSPFFNGAPWRGARGGPRGGRVFDQGDLKYVILQLLVEKPRHGYEIIKAIEERFGGTYSPSPGTVYPTLTMLEDMGYARVTPQEGGKKVYDITDEGHKYLEENRSAVDDIFSRISEFAQNIFGEPMMQVHRAMKDVGRAVYVNDRKRTADQLKRITEILDRAAAEIGAA